MNTPASVCELRDVKGMYMMAKSGKIRGFTGVDDDYDPPAFPEITIDTVEATPEESAHRIMQFLTDKGLFTSEWIKPAERSRENAMRTVSRQSR